MTQATGQTPAPTQLPAPPVPPDPGNFPVIVQPIPDVQMPPPWMTLPPQVTLLIVLGFFAACSVILYPLMRALGKRLEGRDAAASPALQADLEQIRNRLAEVESMQHRVLELEERVDFTERMIAQRREPERLGGA